MNLDLYIIKTFSTLNLTYWKVRTSREEIEQKNPKRKDIIESMQRTESDLLEINEAMQILEKKVSSLSRHNYELQKLCQELLAEVKELKNQNNNLINEI
jgi:uncharacterized coiled-coil DUF342 family protein